MFVFMNYITVSKYINNMIYILNKLKEAKFVNLVIKRCVVSSVRLVTPQHASYPGPLASIKTFLSTQPLAANCIIHGLLYTGSEFLQQTIMVIGGEEEEEEARGYDTGPLVRSDMYNHALFETANRKDIGSWARWCSP